jgi:hypothetical protein
MAIVQSDGNGGVYLKRTIVEKAVLGAFGALVVFIGSATYREIVSLHDSQIHANDTIEHLADRVSELAVQGARRHDRRPQRGDDPRTNPARQQPAVSRLTAH